MIIDHKRLSWRSIFRFRVLLLTAIFAAAWTVVLPAFSQSESESTTLRTNASASIPAVPKLIKFSGILLDSRGYPITVPVDVTFELYSQPSVEGSDSTEAMWKEKQQVSPNDKGGYTVYLGAVQVLPAEVFTSVAAHYIGVQVEAEPEQARTFLTSVPYALESGDAQTLGGLPASAYALAGPKTTNGNQPVIAAPLAAQPAVTAATTVTTTGGATNMVPKFSGASTIVASEIFDNGSSVGIGLNAPSSGVKLDVNGSIQARGRVAIRATGVATTTAGYRSNSLQFISSAWNSSTNKVDNPFFTFLSEPVGNNTAAPSANLNLLFSNNGAGSVETGLYF